jgi:LysR family transcriptional regulator (chromosome initiation inhibitor)
MIPELQLGTDLADGSLVVLKEREHHDVALYWQTWTLDSPRLDRVSKAIRKVSGQKLRGAHPGS